MTYCVSSWKSSAATVSRKPEKSLIKLIFHDHKQVRGLFFADLKLFGHL